MCRGSRGNHSSIFLNPATIIKKYVGRHRENDVVRYIKDGADVNISNGLPIIMAAGSGNDSLVAIPLSYGAKCNRALSFATMYGHESTVRLLIPHGEKGDKDEAIGFAASNNHGSIVEILAEHGADVTEALIYAAEKGHDSIVRILIDRGADVNAHWGMSIWAAITRPLRR